MQVQYVFLLSTNSWGKYLVLPKRFTVFTTDFFCLPFGTGLEVYSGFIWSWKQLPNAPGKKPHYSDEAEPKQYVLRAIKI